MNTMENRTARRRLLLGFAALAIAIAASAGAGAQQFQYAFGGDDDEAGRGGVTPVSDGGYIAVGESFTPSGGTESDVYVVRTESDGSLFWSFTYDAGGNDSATDVEEVYRTIVIVRDTVIVVPPMPPDTMPRWEVRQIRDTIFQHDGFIITGVTDNEDLCPCLGDPSRDLFLLRLDRCGNVMWWKTYGADYTDEIGYDVDIATVGDGITTHPGDFIVAGTTTQDSTDGAPRDGYLLRTDQMGNIIWDRTYDMDFEAEDDYFYSCDQAQYGKMIGGVMRGVGDIIVAGGTEAYGTPGDPDALIGRVDGNSGFVLIANLHGFGVITHPGANDFRSVIERRQMNQGFIVAFGFYTTAVNDRDVYGVETKECPVGILNINSQIAWGSVDDDEAYDVHELSGVGSYDKSLIVTGYYEDGINGLGGKDAFLQELDPFMFRVNGNIHLYGGTGTDWGWSVKSVKTLRPDPNLPPCRSEGFIVCGFTDSPLLNTDHEVGVDAQDLYLIKTNRMKVSGCNEVDFPITDYEPVIGDEEPDPDYGEIEIQTWPSFTETCNDWEEQLCYAADGTRLCPLPMCPPCMQPPPPPDDTTHQVDTTHHIGAKLARGIVEFDATGVMSFYPNPVERGTMLSLRYALGAPANVSITISDIAGRVVYETSGMAAAGSALRAIPTDGWPAGAYLIRMQAANRSSTMRVLVVER